MCNDKVRVVVIFFMFLAVFSCSCLNVEAMENAGALYIGQTCYTRNVIPFVNNNGIGDKARLSVFFTKFMGKDSAESGSMTACTGQMVEIVKKFFVDRVDTALKRTNNASPADKCIHCRKVNILFCKQLPDKLHAHGSLSNNSAPSCNFFGSVAYDTLVNKFFALENSDFG